MARNIFRGPFLIFLLAVCGASAQSPDTEKPVWTMELITVKPGMFGFTLGYLDDNWMRVREEAKRQGVVLTYHRMAEQGDLGRGGNILLLTEYKNRFAYDGREKLSGSISKQLPSDTNSGVLRPYKQEDLFETSSARLFQDWSDTDNTRARPASH